MGPARAGHMKGNAMIKGLVAALVGGAVGAAIWAAVTHFTGYEVGFVAWGVGLLVGIGMAVGAGNNAGMATGVVAAVVAIAAVLGGKYATVHLAVEEFAGAMEYEMTDHDVIVKYADHIAGEWEAEGRALNWPDGSSVETAYEVEDYPADLWAEAEARWDSLGEEGQQTTLAQHQASAEAALGSATAQARDEIFLESFTPFDLLWIGLALFTAFKVGAGAAGDE